MGTRRTGAVAGCACAGACGAGRAETGSAGPAEVCGAASGCAAAAGVPAGAGADEAAGCTGDGEPAGAYAGVATRAGPAGPGVASTLGEIMRRRRGLH